LLCWNAAYFSHGRTLRAASLTSAICAVVLSVLLADFVLSALQLRNVVAPAEEAAFRIGSAKAGLKYAAFILAFLLNGIFSWRAAAAVQRSTRPHRT
ncbi:MAG TPA: hypothetical protein VHG09_05900, partial [Longimicrobiales bacterium]|nr:hypothetical protein [Longimicrobiales bacterium]